MPNVKVQRYANPAEVGFQGWIEPADKSWILFVDIDGRVHMFDKRDPQSGAVL